MVLRNVRHRRAYRSPLLSMPAMPLPGSLLYRRLSLTVIGMVAACSSIATLLFMTSFQLFMRQVGMTSGWLIFIPWIIGVLAAIVLLAINKKMHRKADNLYLGMKGEVVVAQHLNELLPLGYRAFHSIQMQGYDVDHVLIGPSGVYVVETKTRSKPVGKDAKVHFDGSQIKVDGIPCEKDILKQVRGNAAAISQYLDKETGRKIFVKGIIVFPGWYVISQAPESEVKVINPKQLLGVMQSAPTILEPYVIDAYIQAMIRCEGEIHRSFED
jgi:hypothetical protein